MKNLSKQQQGFAVVEAALVVVILVVIGLVAFKLSNRTSNTGSSSSSASSSEVTLPASIKSKTDVSQAIKALDSTPINSKLDPNQLNGDVSALL